MLYGSVGQVIEDLRDCSARTFRDCKLCPLELTPILHHHHFCLL